MRIAIVGTGYVGLVAAACFADLGHTVVGIDSDTAKIAKLERGEVPIFEPGLDEVIQHGMSAGRLRFSTQLEPAVKGVDIVIIAVGTPQGGDGAADLRQVTRVAEELATLLDREAIVVLKSTVPVGTNDRIQAALDARSKHRHRVVSNPEFLKEGDALRDFTKPDRVIIGARDETGRAAMRALYAPLGLDDRQLMFMDPRSAEMTKYVSNAMLATRITFMNEVARLCEAVSADFTEVRLGVGADSRIGAEFLLAGPGFGGSCFPKDIKALMQLAYEHGEPMKVLEAVDAANQEQKRLLFRKLERALGSLAGRTIALWGLAFKARTDDVRDSPALELVRQLDDAGATIVAHDPEAIENARAALGGRSARVHFVRDMYEAALDADALVVATEWNVYKNPDFDRLFAALQTPVLIDGRNIWQVHAPHRRGFRYEGVGVLVR
jgi:UDPglucose 6-dehydrogenase